MIARALLIGAAAFSLGACSLLFPEDEREGDEALHICVGRVRAQLTYEDYQQLENAPGRWVPSYTYDITLLDLEEIQALVDGGVDETVGTRLIQQTANTSAAVERFKTMPVDRKGALFLGRKPSLYRVRGEVQPASTILESGCEAQKTDTRLIEVSWTKHTPPPIEPDPKNAGEEQAEPPPSETGQ